MKKIFLGTIALLGIVLSSCNDDVFGVRGEGPAVTESRAVAGFTEVDLETTGNVYITPGAEYEVRVEAQRNILDILNTSVRGSRLKIDFGRYNVRRHAPINIYITMPELSGMRVSGSGNMEVEGPFDTPELDIRVSGSGKINARGLDVDYLESNISGSGKVTLAGAATRVKIDISGSGDMKIFELPAEEVDARISGSGYCEVTAGNTLKVNISGSGKVYYKGAPATVDVRTSGSGRVINAN